MSLTLNQEHSGLELPPLTEWTFLFTYLGLNVAVQRTCFRLHTMIHFKQILATNYSSVFCTSYGRHGEVIRTKSFITLSFLIGEKFEKRYSISLVIVRSFPPVYPIQLIPCNLPRKAPSFPCTEKFLFQLDYPLIHLSIHPPIRLFVNQFNFLSVLLSVCPSSFSYSFSYSFCLFVTLKVCVYLWPVSSCFCVHVSH